MAKHEFGIMPQSPQKGIRYDKYEPQKYHCILVNDDDLENIVTQFDDIDFFWHTPDVPQKGIDYYGITLIPPTSIPAFLSVIQNRHGLSQLESLLQSALRKGKWVIHYGL